MTIYQQEAHLVHAMPEDLAVEIISNAAASCFGSKPSDKHEHVAKIFRRKHLSVFEHINVCMQLRTDVATYKGLTRHRHCAFTIESTHYKPYEEGLEIIAVDGLTEAEQKETFETIEKFHQLALKAHSKVVARNILPQAQAALVTMTTNLREWYHIFDIRKGKENTTNMWKLMELIMHKFRLFYPYFMSLYDGKYESEAKNA